MRSDARYGFLRALNYPVLVVDSAQNCTFGSAALAHLLGVSGFDTGIPVSHLLKGFPEDTLRTVCHAISLGTESCHTALWQGHRWLQMTVRPTPGDRAASTLVAFEDVTAQHASEDIQHLVMTAMAAVQQGISIIEVDPAQLPASWPAHATACGRLLYANPALEQMLGASTSQLRSQGLTCLLGPQPQPADSAALAAALASGRPSTVKVRSGLGPGTSKRAGAADEAGAVGRVQWTSLSLAPICQLPFTSAVWVPGQLSNPGSLRESLEQEGFRAQRSLLRPDSPSRRNAEGQHLSLVATDTTFKHPIRLGQAPAGGQHPLVAQQPVRPASAAEVACHSLHRSLSHSSWHTPYGSTDSLVDAELGALPPNSEAASAELQTQPGSAAGHTQTQPTAAKGYMG
ncbi:hypothetical protein V8C86DRAFT_3029396 [Haematococcus lacustris]